MTIQKVKITDVVSLFVFFSLFVLPRIAGAAGIVPCDGGLVNGKSTCDFNALIQLVQNVINIIIIGAIPIAGCLFAYAGFKYMTAAGDTGEIKSAHEIFMNVFWGFVIILSAWLIVHTILNALVGNSADYSYLKG